MKQYALLILLVSLLLPTTSFAGPSFSVTYGDDGLTPQQRIRGLNQQKQSSAEERMRAIEDREIQKHTPPPETLTADEVEAIMDKKNEELLKKLKPEATPPSTPTPAEEPSQFGKVGGLGNVGGIGTIGKK